MSNFWEKDEPVKAAPTPGNPQNFWEKDTPVAPAPDKSAAHAVASGIVNQFVSSLPIIGPELQPFAAALTPDYANLMANSWHRETANSALAKLAENLNEQQQIKSDPNYASKGPGLYNPGAASQPPGAVGGGAYNGLGGINWTTPVATPSPSERLASLKQGQVSLQQDFTQATNNIKANTSNNLTAFNAFNEAKTGGDMAKAFLSNPGQVFGGTMASGAWPLARGTGLVLGTGAAVAATGGGAIPVALAGGAAGGLDAGIHAYPRKIAEVLQSAGRKSGIDIEAHPELLSKVMSDPKIYAEAAAEAKAAGINDAIWMGVLSAAGLGAGKIASVPLRVATNMGIQSAGGAGMAATEQLATKGKVDDLPAVLHGGVGGLMNAIPFEAYHAVTAKKGPPPLPKFAPEAKPGEPAPVQTPLGVDAQGNPIEVQPEAAPAPAAAEAAVAPAAAPAPATLPEGHVPPMPEGKAEADAWVAKYGKTHEVDGTPLSPDAAARAAGSTSIADVVAPEEAAPKVDTAQVLAQKKAQLDFINRQLDQAGRRITDETTLAQLDAEHERISAEYEDALAAHENAQKQGQPTTLADVVAPREASTDTMNRKEEIRFIEAEINRRQIEVDNAKKNGRSAPEAEAAIERLKVRLGKAQESQQTPTMGNPALPRSIQMLDAEAAASAAAAKPTAPAPKPAAAPKPATAAPKPAATPVVAAADAAPAVSANAAPAGEPAPVKRTKSIDLAIDQIAKLEARLANATPKEANQVRNQLNLRKKQVNAYEKDNGRPKMYDLKAKPAVVEPPVVDTATEAKSPVVDTATEAKAPVVDTATEAKTPVVDTATEAKSPDTEKTKTIIKGLEDQIAKSEKAGRGDSEQTKKQRATLEAAKAKLAEMEGTPKEAETPAETQAEPGEEPKTNSDKRLENAGALASDILGIIKEGQKAQDEFLAEKGIEKSNLQKLNVSERKALQDEYSEWLKNRKQKPAAVAEPGEEPKVASTPEREAKIKAILDNADASDVSHTFNVREIIEHKGSDGKWYRNAWPLNVKLTGEKRVGGWGITDKNGVGIGKRYATEAEAKASLENNRAANREQFKQALEASSDERLNDQAKTWEEQKAAFDRLNPEIAKQRETAARQSKPVEPAKNTEQPKPSEKINFREKKASGEDPMVEGRKRLAAIEGEGVLRMSAEGNIEIVTPEWRVTHDPETNTWNSKSIGRQTYESLSRRYPIEKTETTKGIEAENAKNAADALDAENEAKQKRLREEAQGRSENQAWREKVNAEVKGKKGTFEASKLRDGKESKETTNATIYGDGWAVAGSGNDYTVYHANTGLRLRGNLTREQATTLAKGLVHGEISASFTDPNSVSKEVKSKMKDIMVSAVSGNHAPEYLSEPAAPVEPAKATEPALVEPTKATEPAPVEPAKKTKPNEGRRSIVKPDGTVVMEPNNGPKSLGKATHAIVNDDGSVHWVRDTNTSDLVSEHNNYEGKFVIHDLATGEKFEAGKSNKEAPSEPVKQTEAGSEVEPEKTHREILKESEPDFEDLATEAEAAASGNTSAHREVNATKRGLLTRIRKVFNTMYTPEELVKHLNDLADEATQIADEHSEKQSNIEDMGRDDPFSDRDTLIDTLNDLSDHLRNTAEDIEKNNAGKPGVSEGAKPVEQTSGKPTENASNEKQLEDVNNKLADLERHNEGESPEAEALRKQRDELQAKIDAGKPASPDARSDSEKWADDVLKRSRGQRNSGVDPELAAALAVKGYHIAARTIKGVAIDFHEWSKEMVKEFGDGVKPHLEAAWNKVRDPNLAREVAEHQQARIDAGKPSLDLPAELARSAATLDADRQIALAEAADKNKPSTMTNLYQAVIGNPFSAWFRANAARMRSLVELNPGSAEIKKVVEQFIGTPGKNGEKSFTHVVANQTGAFLNKFVMATNKLLFHPDYQKMTPEQRQALNTQLLNATESGKEYEGAFGEAVKGIRDLMAEAYKYGTEAGLEMGHVVNYFLRGMDGEAIRSNPEAFVRAAAKAYEAKWNREQAGARAGELNLDVGGQEKKPDFVEMARKWKDAILFSHEGRDFEENILGEKKPANKENFQKEREFTKEEAKLFDQFRDKDVGSLVARYIGDMVRKAEIAKRLGSEGEKWIASKKQMAADGVSDAHVENLRKLIRNQMGLDQPGEYVPTRDVEGTPTTIGDKIVKGAERFRRYVESSDNTLMKTVQLGTALVYLTKTPMIMAAEPAAIAMRKSEALGGARMIAQNLVRFSNVLKRAEPGSLKAINTEIERVYGKGHDLASAISLELGITRLSNDFLSQGSGFFPEDISRSSLQGLDKLSENVQKMYLLHQMETAKRETGVKEGMNYLDKLVDHANGENMMVNILKKHLGRETDGGMFDTRQFGANNLEGLGIPKEEHAQFSDFVKKLRGMSESERLSAIMDRNDPMAARYRKGVELFSKQATVQSTSASKTEVANSSNIGKIIFNLLTYPQEFALQHKAFLYEQSKLLMSGKDSSVSPAEKLKAASTMFALLPASAAMYGVTKLYRAYENLEFNSEDEHEQQHVLGLPAPVSEAITSVSRTGIGGAPTEMAWRSLERGEPPAPIVNSLGGEILKAATGNSDAKRTGKVLFKDVAAPVANAAMIKAADMAPGVWKLPAKGAAFIGTHVMAHKKASDAAGEAAAGE